MKLRGVGVALVTPFNEDCSIDFESLEKIIDYVTMNGADFLVALGTTAETPTLSLEEKRAVVKFVFDKNKAKLPLVVGCGGNSTQGVIEAMKDEMCQYADVLLSVAPFYNKPNQAGMYEHFKAIAKAASKPIMLYNVPGRTGVNIAPATSIRLANDFENIVAIKEANSSLNQMVNLLKNRPEDFSVISGEDYHIVSQIAVGCDGVISVAANAFPKDFCKMVHSALEGKFAEAVPYVYKLADVIEDLFAEGSPAGVKAALAKLGLCKNVLRLPLVPVSNDLNAKICGFIDAEM